MKKLLLLGLSSFVWGVALNEPKVLEKYEIPHKYKNIVEQKYDVLGFDKYIKTLCLVNKENLDYQEKSDYLASDIREDKYNIDVYADGYLRTGETIAADKINNIRYTEKGAYIHLDKLLFDRDYFLSDRYKILYKRLANIRKLTAKNRLLISGVLTYTTLYFSTQNLTVLKNSLKTQEKIFEFTKDGLKKGKNSRLDFILAKSDLLKIKNSIVLETKKYLQSEYILKHSINSHSPKPFLVQPFRVDLKVNSLNELQKQIINQNSEIAMESNILKTKKIDLLSQEKRFIPQINYYSYFGYAGAKPRTFSFPSTSSENWEIGLTFLIPLYHRNDITLKVEKAKYDIVLQKHKLQQKIKDTLIKGTNLFNEIKSLNSQIEIAFLQLDLSKEKLEIYKNKFLIGMISYSKYSKVLNEYLNNMKKLQTLKQQKTIDIALLNILVRNTI